MAAASVLRIPAGRGLWWLWLVAAAAWAAPALAGSAGWEALHYGFSASETVVGAGPLHRNQILTESGTGTSISPSDPTTLPRHTRPDAFARLDSGHMLLSFGAATPFSGAPRGLLPADVIEVDAAWNFIGFRLDATAATGFDPTLNVNAVAIDPGDDNRLIFAIDRAGSINGSHFLASDLIGYDGTTFFLIVNGLSFNGHNINALDATEADGIRYYAMSFESAGQIEGVRFSSSDVVVLSTSIDSESWFVLDRVGSRHSGAGRLKTEALQVDFSQAPDRLFHDRFQQ